MRALAVTLTLVLGTVATAQQPGRTPPRASRTEPARPAPAPRREAAVPFAPGETLTFDVSWSQLLTAGTAAIRVVEKKASYNSTAYHIVADGKPLPLLARFYPLYYKMDTFLDSFTTLSQWSSIYKEENSKTRETSMRFDRAMRRVHYETPADPAAATDFPVPANTQDGLATLYALRGRAFQAGEHLTIPVADEGSLYSVDVEATGPEAVTVPLGRFDAWNLKLSIVNAARRPVGKNIGLWISTDDRRLPVKIQAELPVGSFVLGLREAR